MRKLRSLYPVGNLQLNRDIDFSYSARMENFQIGENLYKVEFHFNNNSLESIILRWDENGISPCNNLLNSLNNKYGQADDFAIPLPQNMVWQKR